MTQHPDRKIGHPSRKPRGDLPSRIALDGPAAAGKTTVGRLLAGRLGYLYFDTGVMYRAVALAALRRQIPLEEESEISYLAEKSSIDVRPPHVEDGRTCTVILDGEDVSLDIRSPEVDSSVSVVSSYRAVREAMVNLQRKIGRRGNVVMVGRDIGTVVMPDADLKIYMDASQEERVRRRFEEMRAKGSEQSLDTVRQSMARRDSIDSTRDIAPLKPAVDAIRIDSSNLTADEVLQRIEELIFKKNHNEKAPP